jgi:hypothetical protein
VHWWQGIPAGRLETSVNALLVFDNDQKKQVMNFGEFDNKFNNDEGFKKLFEVVKDVFFNFQPENRPVLWAMLFTQAKLHHAFLELQHDKFENTESIMAISTGWHGEFEKRLIWSEHDESRVFDNYKNIASRYLKDKVVKYLTKMAEYEK